ncbi:MAG: glutathione S-transferase family protein [Aestuariibacter sp.]
MIKVHHLNNSRSQRVLWLLEELQLDYDIVSYQRDKQTMLAPASLREVHPLGKSPVIEDKGEIIAESGAIIDYLGRVYGAGTWRPTEQQAHFQQYQYWLHFAEGSMMSPLLLKLVMQKIVSNAPALFIRPIAKGIADRVNENFIQPNLIRLLTYVDTHLKIHDWFAGEEISGADIQMSFPLEASMHRGLTLPYEGINEYVQRVQARPAYQRALKRGGQYDYA